MRELIVDNFAGGGGASTGIEMALGVSPDGTPITKTDQVAKCGNSVCPPLAAALVKANFAPRDIAGRPADDSFFLEAAE